MELKNNFYRIVFTNSQEFFVESAIEQTESFLMELKEKGAFTGFITLQRQDSDPVNISANCLFSVQRSREGMIGAQTKLWKLL